MAPPAAPIPRRILVVDDSQDAAQMLAMLLTEIGHCAEYTTDSRACLGLVRSFRPDIVLLDIGMPHLNGYDVARLIRKEFGDGQRICAITAYGKPHDREQSRQAGIDAHLTKPVDVHLLNSIIKQFF
jgi:CheY-like chemotaxis protein